ncbi:MAG: multiubiquitin domain-containing protein [Gemmataceae bacterium]|nr:multiubiquitin domain-containing protein [Gemmataceae bacterium]
MNTATEPIDQAADQGGKKFFVNTEGTEHPWDQPTITTEQIAQLGGWDPSLGVIEIDKDNNERTLRPGEVVELKPGHGFAKKIRFRRG